jgi:acylphosphatase
MAKNLKIKIFGEVQGVGFRDSAYWMARKLHIAGFVMNEPDGSVYVEAEGEEDALKEFLLWCEKGPVTARVDKIEVEWFEAHAKFTGFRIA